jgi:hypothetical protein
MLRRDKDHVPHLLSFLLHQLVNCLDGFDIQATPKDLQKRLISGK